MLQFDVASNLDSIIGNLTDLEAKQVPFAWVLALNRTSAEGQREVRAELPSRFQLRRDWTAKGVRTKLATKANPVALVFTMDWYMRQQEEGGDRIPLSGKLFIPGRSLRVRQGQKSHGQIIASMRPGVLMRKAEKEIWRVRNKRAGEGQQQKQHRTPYPFRMTHNGVDGLWIRERGGSEAGGDKSPIDLLYVIVDRAKIPERWGFERTTTRVADKHLRREFIKALDEGLKSAKGGPIKSVYVEHLKEFDGTAQDWFGGGSPAGPSGGVLASLER